MKRKQLLSSIGLLCAGVLFVATSEPKYPKIATTVDYDQEIFLDPSSPTHSVVVSSSGYSLMELLFRIEGSHSNTETAVLSLTSDDGQETMLTIEPSTMQLQDSDDEQSVAFQQELYFFIGAAEPYTATYTFSWDGEAPLSFLLSVEAHFENYNQDLNTLVIELE